MQPTAMPRTVGEIMTKQVVTVQPGTTVAEAIDLFVSKKFRHLLVADERRLLVGVLSDRDALRQLAQGHDPRKVTVGAVMKSEPVVVSPETRVVDAIDRLRQHRINCLPVIDGGGVMLGIITTTDLLNTLRAVLDLGNAA